MNPKEATRVWLTAGVVTVLTLTISAVPVSAQDVEAIDSRVVSDSDRRQTYQYLQEEIDIVIAGLPRGSGGNASSRRVRREASSIQETLSQLERAQAAGLSKDGVRRLTARAQAAAFRMLQELPNMDAQAVTARVMELGLFLLSIDAGSRQDG